MAQIDADWIFALGPLYHGIYRTKQEKLSWQATKEMINARPAMRLATL
jgi:hypothetical protein